VSDILYEQTPEINLVPQRMDLRLYAGDGATLVLRFVQEGQPLDMSNGELTAQIRTNRTDPEPLATWAVDASKAADGLMTLTLTGEQTSALMAAHEELQLWTGWVGVWDVQWKQTGSEPLTLFQGKCYCDSDVTR
jgi:hypothetical protein